MANGSFGLSGLPTAPTSVGSTPNNPLSPVSAVVNSGAGFQAGDLIYNYAGDIAPVPGNFVGSATFPILDDTPTVNPNTSYGELFASPITKGTVYKDRASAKLTSGNIVIVYLLSTPTNVNYPYFKVVNENGAVIVTDTQISSVIGLNGNISVCALTGGGFAVGWRNSTTNNPYYAIYTNTGGVTLAATQDTGITIDEDDGWYQVVARPDGSWIFAVISSTIFINHKVFSAIGVQIYNWTSVVSMPVRSYWFRYAVRSDNTFIIFSVNASSQVSYTVYSATNTVARATSNITPSNTPAQISNVGGVDVFSNDTTIFTFASGSRPYYVTISNTAGGNTAGTATAHTFTGATTNNWVWAKPKVLVSGNYILSMIAQETGINGVTSWVLCYIVFNASHVAQQTGSQFISSFSAGPAYGPDTVETTNFINFIGAPARYNSTLISNWSNGAPSSLQWAKVSPSTYLTIKSTFVSALVATTSAQVVSGYARIGSTPAAAAFFASTTGTVSATTTAGAVVVAQTTIDTSAACDAIDTASLSDGSCLILYKLRGGTGTIKLAVISSAGVLTATHTIITTATVSSGSVQGNLKLAVLTDGKIAILYQDDTLGMCVSVMSSTYSVLTTPVTITAVSSSGTGLTSLSNGRFAVAYRDSGTNYVYYRVYNSSLTALVSPTSIYTGNTNNLGISCASYPGGFLVTWSNATNAVFWAYSLIENTTNNFQLSSGDQYSNDGARITGQKMVSGTNGNVYAITYTNAASLSVSMVIYVGGSRINNTRQYGAALDLAGNTYSGTTFALTSYNEPVMFTWGSATIIRMLYNTTSLGGSNTTYTEFNAVYTYPSTLNNQIMVGGTLAGRNVLLALINASSFLTYTVINPKAYTYSTTLTAGVTPSNTTAIGLSNGFSLVGVSSTAAPANGSGTVVINGSAQLNSSYPASTTGRSFNFQNPVTFGAAGTISGRNVNLIGNL